MNRTSASLLVIASMIGSGVFTTSGFALADLGDRRWVMLAWLFGGVLAMLGAISYGALARQIPRSGGEYTFLTQTIHPAAGFLAGWVSMLAGFTAPIAAAALGLEAYVGVSGVALGSIVVAGLVHGIRRREGIFVQNGAVIVKLGAILAFLIFAGSVSPDVPAAPAAPFELSAFAVTLVWVSFSYSGWNAAVYVSQEIDEPRRSVPIVLIAGTSIVIALYLGLNFVFIYSAPVEALAGKANIGAVAAEALGGETAKIALSFVVGLGLFTSVLSMMMAGPRVYAEMAKDGVLPRIFAQGEDAPHLAVALQGVLAALVVMISDLRTLLGYIGFTLSLTAVATVVGLFRLRYRDGAEAVPIPGYPWVPGIFALGTTVILSLMVARQPVESLLGLGTALLGLAIYPLIRQRA